ncbi:MAG: sigma-54-dependent Fis family transcriptional regulator [Anaeromyxobacter sp.]|nr:sigma-54-dependent Fis family transcriptional regulator [Anaeromyxobacter sp.]MBL0278238.1 sigma-54-dependent Fis family transcriptional regulator [Anaeromyxobacter sp.]
MRLDDLDLSDLLELGPAPGSIRFGGQRALLLDAVALGLLRTELITSHGYAAARGLLSRFGYAHGWRTAESMHGALPWVEERDWRRAGGRLHTLQGLVRVERVPDYPGSHPFAEAIWHDSYEAEQHLLHLGPSREPVCWTLTAFAAGYMSRANGREVVVWETACVGRGDRACRIEGCFKEEWTGGPVPYDKGTLDASLERLAATLLADERRLAEQRRLVVPAEPGGDEDDEVARSEPMRRALDLARRVARVDSTVLITGESGVGKERIAALVHRRSARAAGPFVPVDCGAVTETLLESELFGHARGAFTGATGDRVGLFEAAAGGTLFLDEVGETSLGMQAKLLRAIQELEVRRVGESVSRTVDVRVVAATNRDLGAEVEAGRFRKDLYYRLKVVEVRVPPLRERPEDVLPLARALLGAIARRMGRRLGGLTPAACELLQRHPWPGNVRELENALERAAAMASGSRVDVGDLPDELRRPDAPARPAASRRLEEVEREAILAALAAHGGNQARTAATLGIGTATLYRKLKAYRARASGRAC